LLSLTQFEVILLQIRYKPFHNLKWGQCPVSGTDIQEIWWQYTRPDARRPSVLEMGESGKLLVNITEETEESLVRKVWGMTLRLEDHEAREFFTYGDQRPMDPHVELIKPLLE
jgi:hypothetical protein